MKESLDTAIRELPRAVVAWLEFEKFCGRESLLAEFSLRVPISQFICGRTNFDLDVEVSHPGIPITEFSSGRKVDFAIIESQQFQHVIETKWINGRRDFKQEVFDDLARLECIPDTSGIVRRFLLIAGPTTDVLAGITNAESNAIGFRMSTFGGILPMNTHQKGRFLIEPSSSDETYEYEFWKKAYQSVCRPLPSGLVIDFLQRFPESSAEFSHMCYLWEVLPMSLCEYGIGTSN